jgi:hypothetical protein
MQQAFRGRKQSPTQNVMAVVSFDLKFTYVLAGWKGSAHDTLILADAIQRDDGFTVPQDNYTSYYMHFCPPSSHFHTTCPPLVGKMYLVDAVYACRNGFLPPYRGIRYHLIEFGNRNHPTNAKELFNLRHSSLGVTVERTFGALKGRFGIVDNKSFHKYKTQVKLLLA